MAADGPFGIETDSLPSPVFPSLNVYGYFPRGATERVPVVFLLHGYAGPDPAYFAPLIRHIVSRGQAVIFPPFTILPVASSEETVMPEYRALVQGIEQGVARWGARVDTAAVAYVAQSFGAGAAAHAGRIVYIRSGMFKYYYNNRFIRFYSTGDILTVPENDGLVRIPNEFGADVVSMNRDQFIAMVKESPQLLELWIEYERAQDHIMHVICSLYIPEDFQPNFELRQYKPRDVIITEGEKADNLFEMLEGEAVVTARGTQIGVVKDGEVFGEISFLTGNVRNATVTAQTGCLIRVVKGGDFERTAAHRPVLMAKISRTLAQRLTEVNERLIRISSIS